MHVLSLWRKIQAISQNVQSYPITDFWMWNGTKKWLFFQKVKQEAQEAEVTCGRRASSRKNEIPSLTRKRSDGLFSHFAWVNAHYFKLSKCCQVYDIDVHVFFSRLNILIYLKLFRLPISVVTKQQTSFHLNISGGKKTKKLLDILGKWSLPKLVVHRCNRWKVFMNGSNFIRKLSASYLEKSLPRHMLFFLNGYFLN